ncbi:hypothetical protein HDU88_001703 [Geranomyces variabilis]|nr:hypothetical protein HDU88_001703 [Geranomyces variabilis]
MTQKQAHHLAFESAVADNDDKSWEELSAMWRDEEQALPLPENRNKQQQRRAERLAWFLTSKELFERLTQNVNEKLLRITHLQGEANKAQSEANNVHANTTAELVTKLIKPSSINKKRARAEESVVDGVTAPEVNLHASPGVESLVAEIRQLHTKKNAEFIESGVLFWGVLDTDDARRMDLISDEIKRQIKGTVEAAMQIGRGPRMAYLLEAETWSHHGSIHAIAKSITSGGLRQLWQELKGDESEVEAVCEDEEVAYLGRCFQDMAAYIGKYAHRNLRNERTMDMHAVASFAKLPGEPLLFYGELMSITDQREKQCRCNNEKKKGKLVDYLYQIEEREIGVAENSGPYCKRHELHAKENLVHLAKTARSQILELSAKSPNCRNVVVPFFHVLDGKATFYIEFAFAQDLFAMHRFHEVAFPTNDFDILSVLEMVEAFLMFKDILATTAHAINRGRTKRAPRITLTPPRKKLLDAVKTPPKNAAKGAKDASSDE